MFRERYLIQMSGHGGGGGHAEGGHGGGQGDLVKGILSLEPGKRADAMNSVEASTEHNLKIKASMHEQMQTPLKDAVTSTRTEIGKFKEIGGILKEGARDTLKGASSVITKPLAAVGNAAVNLVSGTTKMATHLVTDPLGFGVNMVQTGVDWTAKFLVRPPLIAIDNLAKLLGRPSVWFKDLRDVSIKRIDSAAERIKSMTANFRDRTLGAIGLGEGHGHGHAAAAHGH